jgi:hypothetical protein
MTGTGGMRASSVAPRLRIAGRHAAVGRPADRVDHPSGRVGTVEAVALGPWSQWPDALEGGVGMLRPAILVGG